MPKRRTSNPNNKYKKQILWAEDDKFFMQQYVDLLRDEGLLVIHESDATGGLVAYEANKHSISAVILDMAMEPGPHFPILETKGGYNAGLSLARRIFYDNNKLPIIAFCAFSDAESESWFKERGLPYLKKGKISNHEFLNRILRALNQSYKPSLKTFIVHGHDEVAALHLKNYIQNKLHLGEPLILREQPSQGKTIIEKFETYSQDVTLVFVLLTPDDVIVDEKLGNSVHHARQNVIFELGYFYAKLEREEGRVVLLYRGNLAIPSDIAGIAYIDISNGIEAAGESIRREILQWL